MREIRVLVSFLLFFVFAPNLASTAASFSNKNNIIDKGLLLSDDLTFYSNDSSINLSLERNILSISSDPSSTPLFINGGLKIISGNEANGKVLTSNSEGLADWQAITLSQDQDFLLDGNTRGFTSIIGNNTAEDFVIETNNSERLIVKADGNIGIGNSNPSASLFINGEIYTNGLSSPSLDLTNSLSINRPAASVSPAIISFTSNNDLKASIRLNDAVAGSTDMEILSHDRNTNIVFNSSGGSIVLASSSANNSLFFNKGIRFSDGTILTDPAQLKSSTLNCRKIEADKDTNETSFGSGSAVTCNSNETLMFGACTVQRSDFGCVSSRYFQEDGENSFECIVRSSSCDRVRAQALCCT